MLFLRECLFLNRQNLLLTFLCAGLLLTACSGHSLQNHLTRGEEYLQNRKFNEALIEFRAAEEIEPSSSAAHWGIARAYENLGSPVETVESLRKTVELDPNNLEAQAKLGTYYLQYQPPLIAETKKILETIFARNPDFAPGQVLRATWLAVQNQPETDVVDAFEQAIRLDPRRAESYVALSRYYMQRQKPSEAEKAVQRAIAANPNAAAGYIEYGRFLDYQKRADQAEAQFLKAIAVESSNIEARESLADFYINQKRFDKAEQIFLDLIKLQENSPESRVELADFYARTGRETDAVRVFEEVLNEKPQYARARYRLAEIYLSRGDLAQTNAQLEQLFAFNNNDPEALLLRARVRMQENKAADAVADLLTILKRQPSRKNALFYMAQARLQLGQVEQARAYIGDLEKYYPRFLRARLLKIQSSFSAGEPELALRQASELLEILRQSAPDADTNNQDWEDLRVKAITSRGLANLELRKINEAKQDLQEIARLSPNSASAKINLAKVFVVEKNYSEAQRLFDEALKADAKNFDALSGLISMLNAKGEFAEARRRIDQSLQNAAPEVVPAINYLKAETYTSEGNAPAAEEQLQKVLQLDGDYLPAYTAYAAMLMGRSQPDAAAAQYQKVIERQPSASVYTLLGILEESRDNLDAAEKHYRKALEIAPDNSIAANNLAWLIAEFNRGNLDEALRLSQVAVNRQQTAANFYDTLGWVYYKKGLWTPAIEHLKKAVVLDETEARKNGVAPNPAYRLRLGSALASAGDNSSAKKEVETALQSEKALSAKEAQEARNLLAKL